MGYVITLVAPKEIQLVEYAEEPLGPRQVRLRTLFSGISAGTELASYRGMNPHLHKRWSSEQRLFEAKDASPAYPVTNWGYAEVGEVIEIGREVTQVKEGNLVWGVWGHKSTHIADEEWASARRLDPSLDPRCGIFSHVGAIALNVLLDANIHVGEFVAIFGMGVMGLTVTALARLNGGTILAVDGIARRLALAKEFGAIHTIDFRDREPAAEIKALTNQRGADVSIEITGSYHALQSAIRATAYNSKVIAAGFYQGEALGLSLGEEFHHNRIQIISSQISGSNPRLDHRWNRLRLYQTVMQLQAEGRLQLTRLISHTFPAQEASEAFRLLDTDISNVVQVVLKF